MEFPYIYAFPTSLSLAAFVPYFYLYNASTILDIEQRRRERCVREWITAWLMIYSGKWAHYLCLYVGQMLSKRLAHKNKHKL